MNTVMANGKQDQVELKCLLTCIISIGSWRGRGAGIRLSLLNQGGGGGTSSRDGQQQSMEARRGHMQQEKVTHPR